MYARQGLCYFRFIVNVVTTRIKCACTTWSVLGYTSNNQSIRCWIRKNTQCSAWYDLNYELILGYRWVFFKCLSSLSCSCLRPIHWSQVLSREWRCSWISADRRCSIYIWVINNFCCLLRCVIYSRFYGNWKLWSLLTVGGMQSLLLVWLLLLMNINTLWFSFAYMHWQMRSRLFYVMAGRQIRHQAIILSNILLSIKSIKLYNL